MFFFKRFKTVSTNEECLNKLLSIFSKYENEMLNGKYNLCLTVDFLMFFDDLNRNLNNEICDESFKEKYQTKIDKLCDSFKNLTLLKVTGNLKESIKLKFDLKYFANLKSLELENVYIDNILNLNVIVSQLTSIKLNRCLSNKSFEEFFARDVWTSLNCLSINRVTFKTEEFSFVPNSIRILQLQWNQIKNFNLNSSTGSNLTELDLSFNKLKQIPYFDSKELICNTLKVLKLKGNLIDSLKNIENLNQLEHLNLSVNLICNKDEIGRYLSFCKKLKILNLIDNPIQMLDNFNVLILETFPGLKKLNNHLCYSENESTASSNVDLFNDFEDKNSTVSKNDESVSSRTIANKKKDRIAVILDRTDSFINTEDDQSDQDRLSSVSTSKGLSLGLENSYSDLKQIIAEQRKSLGKKLLTKQAANTDLVVPYSTPVDCNNYSIVGEIHKLNADNQPAGNVPLICAEGEQVNVQNLTTNQLDEACSAKDNDEEDNGLVFNVHKNLDKNNELIEDQKEQTIKQIDSKNSISSPSSLSPKEDNLWANEDMESDNIFLVNKLDSNMVENPDPIFILVKDSLIYEKDCATGKQFEVYDLKVITNYELENSSTISLIFDSKVKSKQKVTYNMDSQLDKFKKEFIEPFVIQNQQDKINQQFRFECLKCGTKSAQQTECGTCKSTALIECTNYKKQLSTTSNDKRSTLAVQSSFKDEFLNQVKFKLTNEQVNEVVLSDEQLKTSENDEELVKENVDKENVQKTDQVENSKEVNEDDNDEEVIKLIHSKLENYDLDHFTSVDHELKLYLDVKIFTNNERLEHLFECDFSINDTSECLNGRIVMTNTSLHLVSFKSEDVNSESNHIFDTFTMPLNKIKNIKLTRDYFFHQCIWLSVEKLSGKKKKKKHLTEAQTFFMILKDKKLVDLFCDYLETFLGRQDIKLKININTYSVSEKKLELDTEENIIFSQFIVSLTTKNDLEISKSSTDDLLCLLFEKSAEIILARCEVIANELKFKKICRNDLTNLICAKLEPDKCEQLHLYFSKDSNNTKIEWIIRSYSVNSMSKIIDLITAIWENIYKVRLMIFTK